MLEISRNSMITMFTSWVSLTLGFVVLTYQLSRRSTDREIRVCREGILVCLQTQGDARQRQFLGNIDPDLVQIEGTSEVHVIYHRLAEQDLDAVRSKTHFLYQEVWFKASP